MKRISLVLCLLILTTLALGCTSNPEPTPPSVIDEPVLTPELEIGEDARGYFRYSLDAKNPVLFDFIELSEMDFPCGMWSVNQLVNKYGPYESVESTHSRFNQYEYPDFPELVSIEAFFISFCIEFAPKNASVFSFYEENSTPITESSVVDEVCVLNEDDKNIELEILTLTIYDTHLEFPYGIKIGQSTKSDILAAYPEGSANIYYERDVIENSFISILWFYYSIRDKYGNLPELTPPYHGGITYELDEAGVLQAVSIAWRWFSF